MNSLEQLDLALEPERTAENKMGLVVGSITFAPDQSKPCYCANCVVLQQEVGRLRIGNATIIRENGQLQRELAAAQTANLHLQNRIHDLQEKI